MNEDIRWRQRFHNFRRAFTLLRSAVEDKSIEEFSELEQEGIVHRFEYTFELGWKTFKDYLEYCGIQLNEATPRKVIKECAASGIFTKAGINAEAYLNMMLARNILSHVYDFERFRQIIEKIKAEYLPELDKEQMFFIEKELSENEDG